MYLCIFQFKDRDLINEIRDSNEQLLRKELNAVINASKSDADKLRRIIDERDEEVSSLRKTISHIKHKYVSAANKNEQLIKKVHILASTSRENFLEMDSETEANNNI
jgi:chromosome segregation ATPase